MNKPGIETTYTDENNITYRVIAFRKLSKTEVIQRVRMYLQNTSPRKRPKPGDFVTLHTSTGMLPGL
jgi:hypothetical protein